MIDPNSQFFAILTAIGEAKQANADALGIPWKLTELGVGDANGTDPIPDRAQTKLINERRRRPLNKLSVDPANPNIIVAEQIIPADEGGWWIREIGLYDSDGALVAVANCAPSYKPLMSQGSGRTQVVRMNFIVSSAANVVLKIDPAVVLATRQYVDETTADAINRQDVKQSVLVATTGPIQLAGSPNVDGVVVPLGSRVLVKDQAQAKDNGIYLTADIWKRATDADSSAKVTPGLMVAVEQGVVNADTLWLLSTDGAIVLDTTSLTFKSVTQGLAPINSPAFTGQPTVPTPPLFNSSKLAVNSEFVRTSLGNYSGAVIFTASASLTEKHFGMLVLYNGSLASTITLPPSASGVNGGALAIRNVGGGPLTIVGSGADTISNIATIQASSVVIQPGSTLDLALQGTNYFSSGTGVLKLSPEFANSLASNGHHKLPSGLIIQWGTISVNATNTDQTITLPVAFPEAFHSVVATSDYALTTGIVGSVAANPNGSRTSFVIRCSQGTSTRWLAVGK